LETKDSLENLPEYFEPLTEKQQEILLDWCSMINPTVNMNYKHTSYGMKTIFEKSPDGFYVYNGQMKGAMLKCGFKYEPLNDGIQWFFNVSEKSLKELSKLKKLS